MDAATRIRLLTVGAVLVTALAIGVISIGGYLRLLEGQQRQAIEQQVRSESLRFELSISEAVHDARVLATLNSAVATAQPGDVDLGLLSAAEKDHLADVMLEMLRAKSYYAQARLLGVAQDGQELVRIDCRDGVVSRATEETLQNKGQRDYYREAVRRPPGTVHLSEITLNREHNQIETPHRPMLRVSTRVEGEGSNPAGVIVINVDYQAFIEQHLDRSDNTGEVLITNQSGDYLTHPDQRLTFGFDLGDRHRLQEDLPDLASFYDSEIDALTVPVGRSGLLRAVKVRVFPDQPNRFLAYAIEAPSEQLAAGAAAISRQAIVATICLVGFGVLIALVAGNFQTNSIASLIQGANAFAEGGEMTSLPLDRNDELGVLARAMNDMAAEVRRKESEVLSTNERLTTANEDLEHFVHIAAHDLREPLRKQRNLIDLLVGEGEDDELLHAIASCSLEMQAMIDDFRDLTRLEAVNTQRGPASMRELIDQCLVDHAESLETRNVSVKIEPLPDEVSIYPRLVSRIYDNLVRNTLQHAGQNGYELAFTAERAENGWRYGVRNTGSTIPEEKRQEVFRMFRKASLGGGTGVGLSICRKIVERHRGEIYATSTADAVHIQFTLGDERDGHPIG